MARVVKPAEPQGPNVVVEEPEAVLLLPLDGDEVLFNEGTRWVLAEVVGREDSGELWLLCDLGDDLVTQRATHSTATHGWLTYTEAATMLKRDPE